MFACRRQFEVRLAKGRGRIQEIAENFANLPMLCVQEGYPLSLISNEVRATLSMEPRGLIADSSGSQGSWKSQESLPPVGPTAPPLPLEEVSEHKEVLKNRRGVPKI